ncbi:hypothetical protein N7451_006059 [Penicillium sp. IBT 35674x]|nr:hypothetical protein N7451_006059 [Penicillium sp. IBT 35674x]
MTGMNVIAFYCVSIVKESLGYSGSVARIFSVHLWVTLALGGLVAMFTVDRFGRRIRHKVTAMEAATSWLFNFMMAQVTPIAFANIDWRYHFVYSATSAAGFVVIYLFYPEIRERSLEEIEEIFLRSRMVLDPVRVTKTLPVGLDVLDMIEEAGKGVDAAHEGRVRKDVLVQICSSELERIFR